MTSLPKAFIYKSLIIKQKLDLNKDLGNYANVIMLNCQTLQVWELGIPEDECRRHRMGKDRPEFKSQDFFLVGDWRQVVHL